jgi:hypothetical protein
MGPSSMVAAVSEDIGRLAERANVMLNVGGDDVGIPFLTKPMLDLWVHALHGSNPFLIVSWPDDEFRFVQTYRGAPGEFSLQYCDGPEADLMGTTVDAPGAVVDLIWDWIHDDRSRLDGLDGWKTVR